MRSFVVEFILEAIELALLAVHVRAWRERRLGLHGLVHPLVLAILLWTCGQDALVLDAQADPPDVELREPVDACRGERDTVVGADRAGQAIFAEGAVEDRKDVHDLRREQPVTRQQVAGVQVGHRQRVAVDAISGLEVPLEVGTPDVVGCRGHGRHHTRMQVGAPSTAFLDEATPCQQVARRAHRGQDHGWEARLHPLQDLPWSPGRVTTASVADGVGHHRLDTMRTRLRCPTAIVEPVPPFLLEALDPLVARLPANSVAVAELSHAIQAKPQVLDELFSLFHR